MARTWRLTSQLRSSLSWGDTQGTSLKPPGLGQHIQILRAKELIRVQWQINKQRGSCCSAQGSWAPATGLSLVLTVTSPWDGSPSEKRAWQGQRGAKAKAAHEHSTAQQREGRALKPSPRQEIMKIFFFFNKFISRSISEARPTCKTGWKHKALGISLPALDFMAALNLTLTRLRQ